MRARTEPPARDARGFTLIELMVSLVLFAVGTLALAALIPSGTRAVGKAGENSRASELAAQTMERLLDTPYADSTLTAGSHYDPHSPFPGSYHVTWIVEDGAPYPDCKRISVRVRWPNPDSPRSVRLMAVSPESSWE